MALRQAVGTVGIWSSALRADQPAVRAEVAEAVAELEELGYGALWVGGSSDVGHAARLIEATSRIVVATGILSIWQHEAADVAEAHARLAKEHPGRFLLGLGASHAKLAADYRRPYSAMRAYLDALDAAPTPVPVGERVLAALGPKMLRLSAARSAGAHPYLVTAEHTAQAREMLGDGPLLAPELKVVLESDPERARTLGRGIVTYYLELPNYTANLRRLGFGDDDFRDGGSDRLVDALIAWGDDDRVRARVAEFHAAGADHVALQVVTGTEHARLPRAQWRRLAALLDLGAS
ncbi:LLM class F420-dependent oxidoreductase [Streptomyces sp. NPDC092296]|uniref:LLM class F420-dependent oxidoreductase n=1 Tax=Streptomyces sp. NPDC092296 TaxID=3366012 RepID=UPI00380672B9